VADSPMRWQWTVHDLFQSLERERQVRAALGAGDGMDLVDDHPAHALEDLFGAPR